MTKQFRGNIYHWNKLYFDREEVSQMYGGEDVGLGYCIEGYRSPDPKIRTYWRTSWVMNHDSEGLVETRNSHYRVFGEEKESRDWKSL